MPRAKSSGRSSSGSSRLPSAAWRPAANGTALHARRLVMHDLQDREVVAKLFDTLAPRFVGAARRLHAPAARSGSERATAAEIAQVELVGSEFTTRAKAETEAKGEGAGPKKRKGVSERLRAAAERLRSRGKKDRGRTRQRSRPKRTSTKGAGGAKPRPKKQGPREARKVSSFKAQVSAPTPSTLGSGPNTQMPRTVRIRRGRLCIVRLDLRLQTFLHLHPRPLRLGGAR